jgi:protein-disulfide isomerase
MRCIQFIIALALAMPLLLGTGDGFAQGLKDDELRTAIIEMRNGQAAVLEELKAIRKLLEQGARPGAAAAPGAAEQAELTLRGIDGGAVKGDAEAPLVLVEYTDYQCPFCGRHFADTVPSLASEYLDTGKLRYVLRYVLRDFPLESIHPQAFKAAEAARCAGDQGRYWEMHDALFRNQRALGQAQLTHYAKGLGLDVVTFEACLDGRHADAVRADIAEGQAAGITGTPTFFLAVEGDEPGKLKTVQKIRGAQPYAAFKQAIDAALADLAKAAESG